MQSLFPQYGSVFGGSNGAGRNELVSFNAGKMTVKPSANGKFLVTPDLKKGKICLTRGDDQLLHFQWVDRQTGASPDDFILFPDDAAFSKVNTGREGDRVYLLQYKNSSRRFFFWMQHKDASRDEELAKKVNDYMNNAQPAGADGGRSGAGGAGNVQLDHNAIMQMLGAMGAGGEAGRGGANSAGAAGVQMADLQNILQNMGLPASHAASSPATSAASSSQASQSGAASSTAATTASTHADHDMGAMDMDDMTEEELLRLAIEESMRDANPNTDAPESRAAQAPAAVASPQAPSATPAPVPAQAPAAAAVAAPVIPSSSAQPSAPAGAITTADFQRAMASLQAMMGQQQPKGVSLTKLLSAENVAPLLQDEAAVNALLPHLPEGVQNAFELQQTLRSPQFRQSIGSLVSALQTGNYHAVITNFGLDPAAGAAKLTYGDSVGAFLDAIQQWADRQDAAMGDDASTGNQQ
ncbi:hypothetical protein PINS_up011433 [Pythium insidiosum]|nr:hypothetical protein PINS_up011433 [Pythium insidiosum]